MGFGRTVDIACDTEQELTNLLYWLWMKQRTGLAYIGEYGFTVTTELESDPEAAHFLPLRKIRRYVVRCPRKLFEQENASALTESFITKVKAGKH